MSSTKKALKSELNIKTRVSNKLDETKLELYEPNNLLAEQVTEAVHEYFDSREETYQDLPDKVDKDDLELTADVYSRVPFIAPRLHEDSGIYMNMGYGVGKTTIKNTYPVTNMPLINFGGNTYSNNYNASGLKNSTLPIDGLTTEMMKKGFYNKNQYNTSKFWGNISDKALLESLGHPNMKKYQGTVY